jgi:hypothetical protein
VFACCRACNTHTNEQSKRQMAPAVLRRRGWQTAGTAHQSSALAPVPSAGWRAPRAAWSAARAPGRHGGAARPRAAWHAGGACTRPSTATRAGPAAGQRTPALQQQQQPLVMHEPEPQHKRRTRWFLQANAKPSQATRTALESLMALHARPPRPHGRLAVAQPGAPAKQDHAPRQPRVIQARAQTAPPLHWRAVHAASQPRRTNARPGSSTPALDRTTGDRSWIKGFTFRQSYSPAG